MQPQRGLALHFTSALYTIRLLFSMLSHLHVEAVEAEVHAVDVLEEEDHLQGMLGRWLVWVGGRVQQQPLTQGVLNAHLLLVQESLRAAVVL